MKPLLLLVATFSLLLLTTPAHAVQELIQSGTTTAIPFLLVDSATGQVGQTGQSANCTVTVCKPGTTSYVASSGTITEIGNGLYNYNPTTAETGSGTTYGFLLVHITDTTDNTQVVDSSAQIIAFNPNDAAALGLSSIAATNTASTTTAATISNLTQGSGATQKFTATALSLSPGSSSDPWATYLPGSYLPGQAGSILGLLLGNIYSRL